MLNFCTNKIVSINWLIFNGYYDRYDKEYFSTHGYYWNFCAFNNAKYISTSFMHSVLFRRRFSRRLLWRFNLSVFLKYKYVVWFALARIVFTVVITNKVKTFLQLFCNKWVYQFKPWLNETVQSRFIIKQRNTKIELLISFLRSP